MLDSTVESVTSALKRARASLQRRSPAAGDREPPPAAGSPAEEAIVAKFVSAYESADLDALVALLTDDVVHVDAADAPRVRGPGGRWPSSAPASFATAGCIDLVPTRANGQPAFGALPARPGRASATAPASSSSAWPATGSAP